MNNLQKNKLIYLSENFKTFFFKNIFIKHTAENIFDIIEYKLFIILIPIKIINE